LPADKAFVDTTVLTDALLKQGVEGTRARSALKRYSETHLPTYAIKEFKAGPLKNYVWFYNKVITTNRWVDAVRAIRAIGATPRRNLLGTALKALEDFQSSISKSTPAALAARYPNASLGEIQTAEAKIWLKTAIFRAWRRRRKIVTKIICPLSCYPETDIRLNPNGTIENKPFLCNVDDCCMRPDFAKEAGKVQSLLAACNDLPDKPETSKRRQALRQLVRTPKRPLAEKECRALGDAVFAFQCPSDAVILTTNLKDHEPLAKSVGTTAEAP
jgi:hypothetical protein